MKKKTINGLNEQRGSYKTRDRRREKKNINATVLLPLERRASIDYLSLSIPLRMLLSLNGINYTYIVRLPSNHLCPDDQVDISERKSAITEFSGSFLSNNHWDLFSGVCFSTAS